MKTFYFWIPAFAGMTACRRLFLDNILVTQSADDSPMMDNDYPITIFYSHADEGYIADIPDLKSCSAFGETPVEALQAVLAAKHCWLATAQTDARHSTHT